MAAAAAAAATPSQNSADQFDLGPEDPDTDISGLSASRQEQIRRDYRVERKNLVRDPLPIFSPFSAQFLSAPYLFRARKTNGSKLLFLLFQLSFFF
jgi:hypothetical protein